MQLSWKCSWIVCHRRHSNHCTISRYSNIQTCGHPSTRFGPFSVTFSEVFRKEKYSATHSTIFFNLSSVCIWTLPLHSATLPYFSPEDDRKRRKRVGNPHTCLFIIVSDYSTIVGICMVTWLTAPHVGNFKFFGSTSSWMRNSDKLESSASSVPVLSTPHSHSVYPYIS